MEYTPLDSSTTEIRLIKLLQVTNAFDQSERVPRCDLVHASLDDKPDYVALSYTWGDPRDSQMIKLGHNSVPVTRNLYSALEHLQYEGRVTSRFIWIDALCINQSDSEEKSWQLQLMRDIYQRATFVSIWLGPADTTSDQVMDFLHLLGIKAMEFGLDGGPGTLRNVITQWKKLASQPSWFRDRGMERVIVKSTIGAVDKVFPMRDLNEFYYSINGSHEQNILLPVEGIANLFTRSWWSRIWVLQEISLAQKAGFVCGTKWLSRRKCIAAFNTFKALVFVFQETLMEQGTTLTSYQRSLAMANFDSRSTTQLSMWDTQRYCPFPLLALLRATCIGGIESSFIAATHYRLEATDPRDKICGLLGLAADRDELKYFGFQPDYTQPYQELYISVTSAMLRQGHMAVLCLSQFPKIQVALPSWVPDWSTPLNVPLQATGTDHMTIEPEYKATGSLIQTKPLFDGVGPAMRVSVSGFVHDEVHEIGTTWAEIFPLGDPKLSPLISAKRLLSELVRLSFLRGKLYKNLKERIRAAARTVIAEIGFSDNGKWERIGNQRYHTALTLLMISVNDSIEKKLISTGVLELFKSEGLQPQIDALAAAKYAGEIEAKARGRKPFVTSKGYLGLGPDHVEPSDMIAVLSGCQVPFVLRKNVDGRYEIVGEAYVDGIMDGEAVAERDSVGVIELC